MLGSPGGSWASRAPGAGSASCLGHHLTGGWCPRGAGCPRPLAPIALPMLLLCRLGWRGKLASDCPAVRGLGQPPRAPGGSLWVVGPAAALRLTVPCCRLRVGPRGQPNSLQFPHVTAEGRVAMGLCRDSSERGPSGCRVSHWSHCACCSTSVHTPQSGRGKGQVGLTWTGHGMPLPGQLGKPGPARPPHEEPVAGTGEGLGGRALLPADEGGAARWSCRWEQGSGGVGWAGASAGVAMWA